MFFPTPLAELRLLVAKSQCVFAMTMAFEALNTPFVRAQLDCFCNVLFEQPSAEKVVHSKKLRDVGNKLLEKMMV